MPDYLTLKLLHQTSVLLSISGFLFRGGLMVRDSPLLSRRWMRTWPHLIDTLLLLSGILMLFSLRLNPLEQPWLIAKLVALLAYIGFGFVALRLGRTRGIRMMALAAAIVCFAYMVLVALSKSALPVALPV